MHPDTLRLAAYLDGAIGPDERAELRAHILTCATCTARLERLRADAGRITRTVAAGTAPDVRASVRARLRRPAFGRWLAGGVAIAGGLAALLLFALMLGAGSRGTAGRSPDRLVVTDRRGKQIVVLDARDGARLGATLLGEIPTSIRYDQEHHRLYVMLERSIVGLDARTLQIVARWSSLNPLNSQTGMALDARRARLYVAQPDGVAALALDTPEPMLAASYAIEAAPNALAVTPDGATVFALDAAQGMLWTLAVDGSASGATSAVLAPPDALRNGWLAASADGRSVYALLTRVQDGHPALWRVERGGLAGAPAVLADTPLPWDMELLGTGRLALPRGDGQKGGIELVDAATLATIGRVDPDHDQHHAAPGPDGAVFGLNFTHNAITRYDTRTGTIAWRTREDATWQPWDGVFVPGRWQWPWERGALGGI
jgi:hypothetical protein